MKGMNTKLVLNEPPSRNHCLLLEKLNRSCSEHDVPHAEKGRIIENGLKLFSIDASGVFTTPRGKHATIDHYVKAHRDGAEQGADSNLTKEQLYSRLVEAASAGKMAEYRHLRKQYFALAE